MKTAPEVVIDETKASPELVRAIKKAVDYLLQGAHYWRDGVPAPLDQWQPLYEHLQSVQEHAATRTALADQRGADAALNSPDAPTVVEPEPKPLIAPTAPPPTRSTGPSLGL